jgi:putative hydroxymethylpyrimidine transport system permease protein
MRRFMPFYRGLWRLLFIFFGLLIAWQLIISFFDIPPYLLPSPWQVAKQLTLQWQLIAVQSVPTLMETLLGFVFGVMCGCSAALFLTYVKPARLWFLPVLLISQALPTFVIAPLFVVWFGYGELSKIITCVLMLFFPVASSFYDGLRRTPQDYLDMAKTMGASKARVLFRLQVPNALPSLANGLRIAATFAPMGAIIGEWVGSSRGLGFLMLNANARMQIDMMFAVLLVVIALTLLFYFAIDFGLRRLIFWQAVN